MEGRKEEGIERREGGMGWRDGWKEGQREGKRERRGKQMREIHRKAKKYHYVKGNIS